MSPAANAPASEPASEPAPRRRGKPVPTPAVRAAQRLDQAGERARRLAALVLDVLGGNRSPGEAAQAMGLSVARYYVLEQRAVHGLVTACAAPPTRGPGTDPQRQVQRLEAENRRLTQALARQQAIVRSTQRALGLTQPRPPQPAPGGKAKRKRRPMVRALRQSRRVAPPPAPASTPVPAGTV